MKSRVYIVTDAGPVEIAGLCEEWDENLSYVVAPNMCVHMSAEPQPVNDKYQLFVNPGTGLIAKEFGHKAPRLDLVGRIDTGNSWQLGVTLAHALYSNNGLAKASERAAEILYITGAVDPVSRSVLPVAASTINDKYRLALSQLKKSIKSPGSDKTAERPDRARFILPEGNMNDLDESLINENLLPVMVAAKLDDAYQLISYPEMDNNGITSVGSTQAVRMKAVGFIILGIIALGGVIGLDSGSIKSLFQPATLSLPNEEAQPERETAVPKQELVTDATVETVVQAPSPVVVPQLSVIGQYASRGVFCTDGEPYEHVSVEVSETSLTPLPLVRLCRIRFAVANTANINLIAFNEDAVLPLSKEAGQNVWYLTAPSRKNESKTYTLLVTTGEVSEVLSTGLEKNLNEGEAAMQVFFKGINAKRYTHQLTARF